MASSSQVESLAQRFGPYLEELRDFFRSRHVSFGSLTDLDNFPAHLADPAFHEEMVSMVRSVLYRESESLPRTELMELIAIAVGGSMVEEAASDLHAPLRQILNFVTEVVRSQRMTFVSEIPADDALPHTAESGTDTPEAPLNLIVPQADPPFYPAQASAGSAPVDAAHSSRLPTNDRLSRALIDSSENVASNPEEITSQAICPPVVAHAPAAAAAPVKRKSNSISAFFRHAYWIPGVCVLLLAVVAAFLLQSPRRPSAAPPTPAPTSPANLSTQSKPSAYGSTLAGSRRRPQYSQTSNDSNVASEPARQLYASPLAPYSRKELRNPAKLSGSSLARHADTEVALASTVTPRVFGGREGVFLASSGMMAAHLLNAPAPGYPKLASLTHVEGEVIVQVVVARDGSVEATRVLEGPRLLRAAAEHAIRRWRYRPYLIDGKPTDVATIVTVNFRLTR